MIRKEAAAGLFVAALAMHAAGCGSTRDSVSQKFHSAQQTFDEAESPEDFLRAASLYQEVLDAGFVSGAVLYNQGNAFMRAGQRGRAVACYRRAKRYRPTDWKLDYNLRSALEAQTLNRKRAVIDYLFFWQDKISYGGKFHLMACSAAITFVIGIIALYTGQRRWLAALGWLGLLITLILSASAAYDWYRFEVVRHGVVVTDGVVARKGNAESYEPAFTQSLSEGAEFEAVEYRGDWLLIRLPGAKEGWVRREEVVVY